MNLPTRFVAMIIVIIVRYVRRGRRTKQRPFFVFRTKREDEKEKKTVLRDVYYYAVHANEQSGETAITLENEKL